MTKTVTYKDHLLQPTLRRQDLDYLLPALKCKRDSKPCWTCHIVLANGQQLLSDNDKSFPTAEAALDWAKEMIDMAASPLSLSGQALEQQLEEANTHLMLHTDAMLQLYFPKATARHRLLLKYLILKFGDQGKDKFWDYFLARAIAVTNRKFLSLCRDLVKAGLLRYWRYNSTYFMEFFLGPAWLSVEETTLTSEELSALARGEQIANYRPWWEGDEQYPGEMFGFPCMDSSYRNVQYFSQALGRIPTMWFFRHEANALVRVPFNRNYPTWRSTWHNGIWTHQEQG